MARKDFDAYYLQLYKQYNELKNNLAEMSQEVNEGMMPPERMEQLKATIQPVKNSFEMLSYVKYLLDKPTRKSKHEGYAKRNKNILKLSGNNTADDVVQRNQAVLESLKQR